MAALPRLFSQVYWERKGFSSPCQLRMGKILPGPRQAPLVSAPSDTEEGGLAWPKACKTGFPSPLRPGTHSAMVKASSKFFFLSLGSKEV